MREAVRLEQDFIADCLPVEGIGLSREEFAQYIDHIADRRLEGVGLDAAPRPASRTRCRGSPS